MAVVGAVISTAWATAGGSALIGRLLLSVAVSAISTAVQKKMAKPAQQGIKTEYTTDGGDKPMTFVLGWYATDGHMVCPPMSHGKFDEWSNAYLTYVVDLGNVPGAQIDKVIIDDTEVEFESAQETIPQGGAVPAGKPDWWYAQQGIDPAAPNAGSALRPLITPGRPIRTEKYKDKVWLRYLDGTQTAADPYLLQVYGPGTKWAEKSKRPWTADMVGTGTCYAVLTFRYSTKSFSGPPRVRFVMRGIPLYDPRKDSTAGGDGSQRGGDPATWAPTTNGIVLAYNILRGIPVQGGPLWGYGVTADALPLAVWGPAMTAADQAVEGKPRWQAAWEVSVDEEPAAVLDEVLKACCAKVAEVGGIWRVRVGPPAAPVYFLTDDDLILDADTAATPFPGLEATYNGVHATYPEPAQLWRPKDAPPRYNAAWEAADQSRRLVAELNMPACPWGDQVQRVMRAMIEEERHFRRHELPLPPDAEAIEPLDVIAYSSAENGYETKLFEVFEVAEDPVTMNVTVSVTEVDPADYDWKPDFKLPSTIAPVTRPTPSPAAPQFFTAEGIAVEVTGKAKAVAAQLRWGGWALDDIDSVLWEIRKAGAIETARGMMGSPEEGETVVSPGLAPQTPYEARISFMTKSGVPASWTGWKSFQTPSLQMDIEDFGPEVRATVDRFDKFVADTPATLDKIRRDAAAETKAVGDRLTNTAAGLSGDVAAARKLALDNLNVAQSYTDTSVQSEAVARQTEAQQLAARIDQITAAATSSNLLANGDFADGVTAWSGGVRVVDGRAQIDNGLKAIQTFPAAFSPSELFQWRLLYNRANGGSAEVRVAFLNSSGAQLGSDVVTALPGTNGTDKVASGQHAPPSGTAQVRMIVSRSGATMAVDEVAASRIDQQMLARIQSLEVAVASDTQALATYKTTTDARIGQNEAAITAEATARADADSALSQRITTTEATTRDQAARITATETTLADTRESIAQVGQLTEAESGRRDLVRDGTFVRVATWWPGGTLTVDGRIVARDEASSDNRIKTVPAPRFLNLGASEAVGTWRDSDFQPVTAGEVIEVGFDYARGSTSVVPAVRLAFYGPAKAVLGTYVLKGDAATNWKHVSDTATAPAGSVYAKVQVGVVTAGSAAAGVTNVTALRTGAGYASKAAVETVAQAQADDQQSLATYKTQVSSRFDQTSDRIGNVETKAQANADALLNVYTKTQTNQAIAGQINNYNATLTDRLGQKANASTVSALDSRVRDTETGLQANSNAIVQTNADVGRFKAGGLFRVESAAAPSGASSRIALSAAASAAGATTSAGLFLEAVAGGKSRTLVVSDQFAVVTDANGVPQYPFIVDGTNIVMDAQAWIKDLSVDTLKIRDAAVSDFGLGGSGKMTVPAGDLYDICTTFVPSAYAARLGIGCEVLIQNRLLNSLSALAAVELLVNGSLALRVLCSDMGGSYFSTLVGRLNTAPASGGFRLTLRLRGFGGSSVGATNVTLMTFRK